MKANRVLALVSAAQLASGLGGMALTIRRRHAFDIPFWRGQPSAVGRDCVLIGTALSAPVVMHAAQAWAMRPCCGGRTSRPGAPWVVWVMSAGYLAERLVRQRLTRAGWDTAETPVVVAGMSLAAAMALIGLRPDGAQEETSSPSPLRPVIGSQAPSRQKKARPYRIPRRHNRVLLAQSTDSKNGNKVRLIFRIEPISMSLNSRILLQAR